MASPWCPTFSPVRDRFLEKLAATSDIIDNETRTVFFSYVSDWYPKENFDIFKHVKYKALRNTYTVTFFEASFHKHNQENFSIFFQTNAGSGMQEVGSDSQRLVLLEESTPCPPLQRAEWGFLVICISPNLEALLAKREYQLPVQRQLLHPSDHFPQ